MTTPDSTQPNQDTVPATSEDEFANMEAAISQARREDAPEAPTYTQVNDPELQAKEAASSLGVTPDVLTNIGGKALVEAVDGDVQRRFDEFAGKPPVNPMRRTEAKPVKGMRSEAVIDAPKAKELVK